MPVTRINEKPTNFAITVKSIFNSNDIHLCLTLHSQGRLVFKFIQYEEKNETVFAYEDFYILLYIMFAIRFYRCKLMKSQ